MSMAASSLVESRLKIMDAATYFSWEERYRMIVPKPGEDSRLFAFIRPFDGIVSIHFSSPAKTSQNSNSSVLIGMAYTYR